MAAAFFLAAHSEHLHPSGRALSLLWFLDVGTCGVSFAGLFRAALFGLLSGGAFFVASFAAPVSTVNGAKPSLDLCDEPPLSTVAAVWLE